MMLRKVFLPLLGFWLVFLFLSAATAAGQNISPDLVAAQDRTRSVEERSRTILALGRSGDAQVSGPLLQILKDPSEPQRVRASTVIALSRIGQPRSEILSAYEASYRSPATDKNLRYTLLHALGQMKAAESLSLLSEALADGDDGIRFKAAQALGMIEGDSAVKVLIARFELEGDRMVRAEIVRALGGNESPPVEGLLVRALRTDPEPLVRYNAALSLVKFKSLSAEGGEALKAAGSDPSPMVQKAVREGVR